MSSILSSAPLIPTAKAHPPSRSAQSVATSIALAFVIIIPFRRPLSFSLLFSVPTVGVSISVCLRNHHNQTAFQPDIDHNQTGYRVRPNRTAPSDGGTASARAAPPPPQAHVTRSRRGHSAAAPQRRARAALAALSCPHTRTRRLYRFRLSERVCGPEEQVVLLPPPHAEWTVSGKPREHALLLPIIILLYLF